MSNAKAPNSRTSLSCLFGLFTQTLGWMLFKTLLMASTKSSLTIWVSPQLQLQSARALGELTSTDLKLGAQQLGETRPRNKRGRPEPCPPHRISSGTSSHPWGKMTGRAQEPLRHAPNSVSKHRRNSLQLGDVAEFSHSVAYTWDTLIIIDISLIHEPFLPNLEGTGHKTVIRQS